MLFRSDLPRRAPRPQRPLRHAVAFWLERDDGRVLFVRRPDRGILGGTAAPPVSAWRDSPWPKAESVRAAPVQAEWQPLPGVVRHGFTHFRVEMRVLAARVAGGPDGLWQPESALRQGRWPTLTRKLVAHALAAAAATAAAAAVADQPISERTR